MIKILFVCHGNICRSPMAEYIFKYKTKGMDFYCESRAVSNEEIGNDINPKSKRVMDKHHIPYSRHYARKITQNDYDEFDVIFVMDDLNLYYLNKILKDDQHKVFKLYKTDIEDPWYTDNYEKVYEEISEGIDAFLKMD